MVDVAVYKTDRKNSVQSKEDANVAAELSNAMKKVISDKDQKVVEWFGITKRSRIFGKPIIG